jgi:hypothetical protein
MRVKRHPLAKAAAMWSGLRREGVSLVMMRRMLRRWARLSRYGFEAEMIFLDV